MRNVKICCHGGWTYALIRERDDEEMVQFPAYGNGGDLRCIFREFAACGRIAAGVCPACVPDGAGMENFSTSGACDGAALLAERAGIQEPAPVLCGAGQWLRSPTGAYLFREEV